MFIIVVIFLNFESSFIDNSFLFVNPFILKFEIYQKFAFIFISKHHIPLTFKPTVGHGLLLFIFKQVRVHQAFIIDFLSYFSYHK